MKAGARKIAIHFLRGVYVHVYGTRLSPRTRRVIHIPTNLVEKAMCMILLYFWNKSHLRASAREKTLPVYGTRVHVSDTSR